MYLSRLLAHAALLSSVAITTSARADADPAHGALVRIAAGAAAPFKDDEGLAWSEDHGFVGGKAVDRGGALLILSNRAPQVYRKEREGVRAFSMALPNGRYTVALHFVENDPRYFGKGRRVLAVDIEGSKHKDLDIWNLTTGQHVPLVYTVPVFLTDGVLNIAFSANKGRTTVSGIEIAAASGVKPTQQLASGKSTTVFDPSMFQGDNEQLKLAATSDDRSSFIKPSLESATDRPTGLPGAFSMRVDYTVNALMAYSDHAYFTLDTPVDLTGKKSISFWVLPDGSGRKLYVGLKAVDGTTGTIGITMTDTRPRIVHFALQNMGKWDWYNTPKGTSLDRKLASLRFDIWANSNLGGGTVYVGPIVASTNVVPPITQPAGPDHAAVDAKRFMIDGFERFHNSNELREHYGFIPHEGMSIVHLQSEHKVEGKQAMRVDYSFGKRHQSGFTIVREYDLQKYNVLRFWLRGDGSGNKMRVFDASGGYFRTEFVMPGPEGAMVELPFAMWIGFPVRKTGPQEFGFWVLQSSKVNEGTIYVDQMEFASDPKFPQGFAPYPDPVPLPGNKISRIDVGADVDRKDELGNQWFSDRGFYWGRSKVWGEDEPTDFKGPQRKLFVDERYGMLGYGFHVPNGDYLVHLLFVEPWAGALAVGRRVCAITVNGEKQPDMDIYKEAGGRFVPVTRKIATKVTDGKLEILFRDVKPHCKLDGISVIPSALAKPSDR